MDINKIMELIGKGKNQYFVVSTIEEILRSNGYHKLLLSTKWELELDSNYYITLDGSVFAFSIPNKIEKFNFIGSHTDSPTLTLKPNPIINESGYMKLNVEIYGGPILNTWFDRPLGLAGKVSYIDKNKRIQYSLFDTEKAVGIIPNLAIHQNRTVNEGVAISKQKEILPLIGNVKEHTDISFFENLISEKLKIDKNDILTHNISAYISEEAKFVGINNEFIAAPRMDNLVAVYTSLDALISSVSERSINFFVAFDNEEIGSNTVYGADSNILASIINRIKLSLSIEDEELAIMLAKSTFIAADMAHAIHPNFPEKSDPTNKLKINEGIAIKSAIGKYATTVESSSEILQICRENNIPYQFFINRNDMISGSTIGPAISAVLSVPTIDIGVPMLAMHSAIELIGVEDLVNMNKLFKVFYQS